MSVYQGVNLRTMVIRPEATPGTWDEPQASDANIRIRDPQDSLVLAVDDENSKYANGSHAEDESISGAQSGQISCSVRVAYSGAVATEPNWWKLAKLCGCTPVAYTTVGLGLVRRKQYDDVTYSVAVYDTELGGATPVTTIYKYAGCVGNMVIRADNVGAPLMADFAIQGKLYDIVDGTKLALASTVQTQIGERFLGSTFTLHGTSACISSFSFDLGNEINPIMCQSDNAGYLHYALTGTRPRFSCNPLSVNQATTDYLNLFLTESSGVISLATTNFTLKLLDTQLMPFNKGSREQFVNYDLTYKCLQNGTPGSLADSDLTLEDTFELLQGSRT